MHNKLSKWLLVIALAITAPYSFAKNTTNTPAVGTITLLLGQVQVTGPERQGTKRLTTGAKIYPGDRLVTRASGHAHLRFIDGALLSLRPSSRLTIQEYHYDSQNPANNQVAFKLEEGIARSISGKAAQSARENFRMNTPIAAIGVRGTDFIVHTSQDRTRALVTEGGIVLSGLEMGCQDNWCGQLELQGGNQQLLELDLANNHPRLMRSNYNQSITSTALNNEFLALVEVNDLPQRTLAQAELAHAEQIRQEKAQLASSPTTLAALDNQEVKAAKEVKVTKVASRPQNTAAPASPEVATSAPNSATQETPATTSQEPLATSDLAQNPETQPTASSAPNSNPELAQNAAPSVSSVPSVSTDSEAAVDLESTDLAQTDNDLAQTDNELAQTDNELAQTDNELAQADNDLAQADSDLAQADSDLAQTDNELAQADSDLAQAAPEPTEPESTELEPTELDPADSDLAQADTSKPAASKPKQDDLVEQSDLLLALETLAESETTENALVWGYLNTNQDTLPNYVKDNAGLLALSETHQNTQITNQAYALYRRNQADEFIDPSLPALSFTLNNASAWLNWQDFREPMQVGQGLLLIDFSRGGYITQLELNHQDTGKITFSSLGSTDKTGRFGNTSNNKSLEGLVSQDGKEAAYLFQQNLPSLESSIDGITHWGVIQPAVSN